MTSVSPYQQSPSLLLDVLLAWIIDTANVLLDAFGIQRETGRSSPQLDPKETYRRRSHYATLIEFLL